jgi:rsbT antagonist protein RsbS
MERIPILKMGELLLVTIQVDMHDQLAMTLQDDLTDKISRTGARGVLIDISAVEVVDSFIGRMIANIAAMPGVRTALNVERGMALLRAGVQPTRVGLGEADGDAEG